MIELYSGKQIELGRVQPSEIDIFDIAHSLANQCRFAGHVKTFYSVAQHSVRVAKALPPDLQLVGLMHDAPEAYIGDIMGPLKNKLKDLQAIEQNVWRAIAKRYDLPIEIPSDVFSADELAYYTECYELRPNTSFRTALNPKTLLPFEDPLPPRDAAVVFIETFHRLILERAERRNNAHE